MKVIKLDFKGYQDKLNDEKLVSRPTEHYYENESVVVFVFKSRERWDYYSIVQKQDIIDFSENINIAEEAIDFFKLNYCEGLSIKGVYEVPEVFNENAETANLVVVNEPVETTTKGVDIDPGDEMVDEATGYSDFLLRTFNKFERQVLAAANKIQIEKGMNKTFGEFLADMFNQFNSMAFAKQLKRFLKLDLVRGMEAAENETNTDIGFTQAYEDKLNQIQGQEIDGYTINGKKWFGIKGVTKEIQAKVINTVQSGVNNKDSLTDIKAAIKNDFKQFSDWRSEMIARTETNRIINQGKLVGYKESGLTGGKVVMVAIDNRTSPICRRLHAKYGDQAIPLDDPFIDPESNQAYVTPPFHVNCRSTIGFLQK